MENTKLKTYTMTTNPTEKTTKIDNLPNHLILHKADSTGDASLQLSPISINLEYCMKWNINTSLNDFVCLTKNGNLISNSLYRIGGMGTPNLKKDEYFMILKYVEAFYPDDITKIQKDKPHLEGRWCIIDKNGVEKVELSPFKSPYLVKNSCIYSIDSNYYNIETGELYGRAYSSMASTDYLFLDNKYAEDKSKCGVMKINKKDGTWELFP